MTALTFCFDEVYRNGDSLTFRLSEENQKRPVFLYWVGMFCFMAPEKMYPVGAEEVDETATHFVYAFEMNWDLREWSYARPGESMVVLPDPVARAVRERRAVVLVSFAHEGRAQYLGTGMRGETTPLERFYLERQPDHSDVCVFDKLSELAEFYDLLPEQLWFVTGNMLAEEEERAWRADRGVESSPFTMRMCELSSIAVGLSTRESALRGRGIFGIPIHVADYGATTAYTDSTVNPLANWQQLKIRWIDRPFGAYRPGEAWDDPRWRYACMNRTLRTHRWWVVERLYREGLLEHGCVSFPSCDYLNFASAGSRFLPPGAVDLLEILPLSLDVDLISVGRPRSLLAHARQARRFFAENTHTVSASPDAVLRGSALEIVTETYYGGGRFVSEKTFKALLDRGPAAIVGSWGTLDYLRSIGVETWGDVLDESYDLGGDPRSAGEDPRRFEAVMDTVLPIVRDESESRRVAHACRRQQEHNFRWLVEAEKPWDRLLSELGSALAEL